LSTSLHPSATLRTDFFLAAVPHTALIAQGLLNLGADFCPCLHRQPLNVPQCDLIRGWSLCQYLIDGFCRFR
jgi:hypothetical protein